MGAGQVFDWNSQTGIGPENTDFTLAVASGLDYTQSFAAVSEPETIALLGPGLLVPAGYGRKKRKRLTA